MRPSYARVCHPSAFILELEGWGNVNARTHARHHRSLRFVPQDVWMKFDVNAVLAGQQQHMDSQNKNKGQNGFPLGQGKRWVFQKLKGEVAVLDKDSLSPTRLGTGCFISR